MKDTLHTQETSTLISKSKPWRELKQYALSIPSLNDLFRTESRRSPEMTFTAADWTVDFSRNLVDKPRMDLLFQLARDVNLEQARDDMFAGKKINSTEQRAALHTALRAPESEHIFIDGIDIVPKIHEVLAHMREFTSQIQSGERMGYTGKKIKNIVAIGIGGSNLGPEMACHALQSYRSDLDVRFVSNVDPTDLSLTLKELNPEETLFIIASKTFTTLETMSNANEAKKWLISAMGNEAVANHFVALSTNTEKVKEFGIDSINMFEFWDWVGGRYSVTSSIGLPLMLATSPEVFDEMLRGFRKIDEHYKSAPLEKNIPVIMALLNIWNTSFLGMQTHAVEAYDEYLSMFADHLQQLVMESLGKSVTQDGVRVDFATCPVWFGGIGTNVQHSYFELLHQGAGYVIPVDFIAFATSKNPLGNQHKDLLLNMIAQANVMAQGVNPEQLDTLNVPKDLVPHQTLGGNKPSTIFIADELTPSTLGQLIGLYEHMVHTWGTILGINPFDQFGVEAGKRMAKQLSHNAPGELTHEVILDLLQQNEV